MKSRDHISGFIEVLFVLIIGGLITFTLVHSFTLAHSFISTYDAENDKALAPATSFYNGFVTAFLNVITIIFVYFTFKMQRNQIRNSTKNVEFNRAVDVIYKQLEISEIKEKTKQAALLEEFNSLIDGLEKLERNVEMKQFIELYLTKAMRLLGNFNNTFNIFKNLVYNNSLTRDEIRILVNIVDTNYLDHYKPLFDRLLEIYDRRDFMNYLDTEQERHDDNAHWVSAHNDYRSQYTYIYEQFLAVCYFSLSLDDESINKYRKKYLIVKLESNKVTFEPCRQM